MQFNYREAGDGRCAPILIHGWASRLDLRDHGRSDAPPEGYSMRQFADDTAALARSRRVRNAIVVGHSIGSTVSLEMARPHPRLVAGVVVVDGALDQYATSREVDQSDLWRALAEPPYEEAMVEFYANFFPDPRDAALAERVVLRRLENAGTRRVGLFACESDLEHPGIAVQVRQPVLYVDGGHNLRPAAAVHEVLPHPSYAQAALCGHFVQLEASDQLVAIIRRFVERLPATTATR